MALSSTSSEIKRFLLNLCRRVETGPSDPNTTYMEPANQYSLVRNTQAEMLDFCIAEHFSAQMPNSESQPGLNSSVEEETIVKLLVEQAYASLMKCGHGNYDRLKFLIEEELLKNTIEMNKKSQLEQNTEYDL